MLNLYIACRKVIRTIYRLSTMVPNNICSYDIASLIVDFAVLHELVVSCIGVKYSLLMCLFALFLVLDKVFFILL